MSHKDSRLTRNLGFISATQQKRLTQSTVAIAGVGGVGGRIATELARLGVGKIKIADPDVFTITNLNRQEGSYQSNLGESKATVIARLCRDVSPDIEVDAFNSGISADNLTAFTKDCDLIVEATDFTLPHLGVQLAREARRLGIPMIMGVEIGFGATVTWFQPHGQTYEKYLGVGTHVNTNDLEQGKVKVKLRRWLPHIPAYGDLNVMRAVSEGNIEAPAIVPAVDLCAAMASTLVAGLLVGYKVQPPAPAIFHMDVKERRSRIIRFPLLHHYLSLIYVLLRNKLNMHDRMGQ